MSDELARIERELGLLAQALSQMVHAFRSLEERVGQHGDDARLQALSDRMDEYRVRGRSEVSQLADRIERIEAQTGEAVAVLHALRDGVAAAINEQATRVTRLHDALDSALDAASSARVDEVQRSLDEVRDELRRIHGEIVTGTGQLRTDLAADAAALRDRLVEEVAASPPPVDPRLGAIEEAVLALRDQLDAVVAAPSAGDDRLATITETLANLRDHVAAPSAIDDRLATITETLANLRDQLDAVVAAPSAIDDRLATITETLANLRDHVDTLASAPAAQSVEERMLAIEAAITAVREHVVAQPSTAPPAVDDRMVAIEQAIAALRDDLAIDRIEASMRDMAEGTSGLRADVRRSFDRVLHEISSSEESLKGEVRAIDSRLGGMADDLRLVRGLRDGLEALASGVDAVRQLASKSATSTQMTELAGDLSAVLAEIEAARAQVLAVDQHVGLAQAAIDVGPPDHIQREVEQLERTITDEIGQLGRRIEQLATQTPAPAEDPIVRRLRSLATSARQLRQGMAEDLRSRRKAGGGTR